MAMPLVGFLTFPGAWAAGLYVGLLFDLAAILVFAGLPRLVAVVALQFYWLALAANRLYYDYFHDVLHPAVVRSHGADVPYLKDALAQMMARGAMMWSFLLFVLSLAFVRKGGHPRLVGVGVFVAGLAAFFSWRHTGPAIFAWEPTQLLRTRGRLTASQSKILCNTPDSLRERVVKKPVEKDLRRELGLDPKKPVPIIVLVVESMRAFEFYHPSWAETIFPQTTKWIRSHGIAFEQAYTQVFEYGQSSRGQFSILCSRSPHFHEEAVFIEYPAWRGTCLPQMLKARGYRTAWFHGNEESFHGQAAFLSRHGIDEINGMSYFAKLGIREQINSWGYGDRSVLAASADRIAALAKEGPVFASIMTSTSHPPFLKKMASRLPKEFFESHRIDDGIYQAFAGTFHYTDQAIGEFLEKVFASPELHNAVVVLVADHSSWPTPFALTEVAKFDMSFRIPLVLLTRKMPRPRRIDRVVTQAQIAPTLASLLGLATPEGWEGQSLFDESPVTWRISWEGRPVYRTENRYCLPFGARASARQCFDLEGLDPLFYNLQFHEVAEVAEETEEYCHSLERAEKEIRRLGEPNSP